MKRVVLILVLLAAAALMFADGASTGLLAGYRNMYQLTLQEQVRTAVQNQLMAQLRLAPQQVNPQEPAPGQPQLRWQSRSGDGDCDCDRDPDRVREQAQDRLRDGTGDGVPDRDRVGKS
jgi:hypothetical protein